MAKINSIRSKYFNEGKRIVEIARETGTDVKTVKKYILKDDVNTQPPQTKKTAKSKLDPFKEEIDCWLEQDKLERRKQRHTALRVFKRLQEKHGGSFDCSYRLVATYVAQKRKELYGQNKEFYFALEHKPGEAQVDFGEADFLENGVRCHGYTLNVSFPYSNGGYLQLFKGENQQCLMEGLMNVFNHIGGVPNRIWFDNASSMVSKILKEGDRILSEHFLRFKNHYGFEAVFCNPQSGNEKGSVESKVGYHRRNLLVPVPEISDLMAFNKELLARCDQDMERPHYSKPGMIRERFEEDRTKLLTLARSKYDESILLAVRTDAHAKFTLEKGRHTYSSAPKYAKTEIWARLTAHEVIVMDRDYKEIITHPRLYGQMKRESMNWIPYLTQLSRRPAALKYTGIYGLFPSPLQEFLEQSDRSSKKETLKILAELSEDTGFLSAVEAFLAALERGAKDSDSVLAIFRRLNTESFEFSPVLLPSDIPELPPLKNKALDYDLFLGRSSQS